MRKLIFLILWLSCLSCGQSNSDLGFLRFKRPDAPKIVEKANVKYRDIAYRLDTLFSRLVGFNGFNGAVIVCKDAEVIYRKAFGFADKENKIPVTDTTAFQLASVSKVITATAVLMLVEQGLINLDDNFATYFPEFPYDNITIKHLLSHRSGLPNYLYFLNDIVTSKNKVLTNSEVLKLMVEKKPALYLKPNKAFNYCNTNYALLALLIEKVSEKSFSAFLNDEIFKPVGMKHSGTILSLDIFEKAVSKPYDARWKPIETEASDYVVGDKSIYSTPYDMFLFSEALYQGKLLKHQTQELAYTALSREKKLSNYGLGWRMKDYKDDVKKEVFHNGWWHGYRTAFHRRLSDKITIVVLSNQLNRSAYQTYKIYQALDADTLSVKEADEE